MAMVLLSRFTRGFLGGTGKWGEWGSALAGAGPGSGQVLVFLAQAVEFGFEGVVLGHLAFHKAPGERGFFSQASGGEQVGVAQGVRAVGQVAELDEPFFGRACKQ